MRKTNKAVRKRFKITGTGKVLFHYTKRRHLAGSKSSKKKRALRRAGVLHYTDVQRVKKNLPFG